MKILPWISLLALPACFSGCPTERVFPELSMQVVDDRDGTPLTGITVQYGAKYEVSRGKFLGFIQSPEPTLGFRLELLPEVGTDRTGLAIFGERRIALPANENLSVEMLLINVRVDASRSQAAYLRDTLSLGCRGSDASCHWPPSDAGIAMWVAHSDSERRALLLPADDRYTGVVLLVHGPPRIPALEGGGDSSIAGVEHISERSGPERIVVRLRGKAP